MEIPSKFAARSYINPDFLKQWIFRVESDQYIGEEIPDSYNNNGKYLGDIEIHSEFTYK